MLRVGLTGELGSGKTTVAQLLARHGAVVMSSDEIGRELMRSGQDVYRSIVEHFGTNVVTENGELDRPALAKLAFDPSSPRVEELNAIIHPAVIAEQERRAAALALEQPDSVLVIESALLFTTRHSGSDQPWRRRFDCIVLVTAPDEVKVHRFISRTANRVVLNDSEAAARRQEALARLMQQRIPADAEVDFYIENNGGIKQLQDKVDALWGELSEMAKLST